jgi:hypothetical protein
LRRRGLLALTFFEKPYFNYTKKLLTEALHRFFAKPLLPAAVLSVRLCKPLSVLSFTVFVVSACAVAYFLFYSRIVLFLEVFVIRFGGFKRGGDFFFNYSLHN